MARTTGPILAIGGITVANSVILNGRDIDWRVPIATGIAAMAMSGLETAWPDLAVGIAYLALVAVLFTRTDPAVPAPAESFVRWWNGGGSPTAGRWGSNRPNR